MTQPGRHAAQPRAPHVPVQRSAPAGREYDEPPGDPGTAPAGTPYTRRHWLTVLAVGALLGWAVHALWVWSADCEEMECIGTGLVGVGVGTVGVPVLALAAMAAARIPSPLLVGLGTCLAGLMLGTSAAMLDAAVRHLPPGDQPVPLWLGLLAGAGSAAAGVVLGGAGFTRAQRVGVALGLLMLVGLTSMPLSGR